MYLVIELSNTKVKATLVSDKTRAVKKYVTRDLGEGVVQNGYINKPEELESALSVALTEFPKTKGCIFLLNTTDILQKELDVPAGKPAVVKTVVQNQMNTVIGTGKEYSIDYAIKESFQDSEGVNFHRVFAYAAPVQLLQAYVSIAKNLGLKLLGIDVPHSAFNKAIRGATINDIPLAGDTSLIMKLGYKHLHMFLLENGQCTYSRTVDFDTDSYLADLQQIDPNATFQTISLNPAYAAQYGRVQELLDPMTGGIVDEIYRLQQYTYSRQEIQPIKNVFVFGPLTSINGMVEYLNANLDVPVHLIQTLSTLSIEGQVYMSDALIPSGAAELKNSVNLAASIPGLFEDMKVGASDTLKVQIPIFAVVVAIVVGVYAFCLIQNNSIKNRTQDLKDAMTAPSYVESLSKAKLLQENKAVYQLNDTAIKLKLDEFDQNYLYTKDVVYDILLRGARMGITFTDISYAEGELLLACTSSNDNELVAPQYAQDLRTIGPKVRYVTYIGEELQQEEAEAQNGETIVIGDTYYMFEITVGLKDKEIETTTTETVTQAETGETTTSADVKDLV